LQSLSLQVHHWCSGYRSWVECLFIGGHLAFTGIVDLYFYGVFGRVSALKSQCI